MGDVIDGAFFAARLLSGRPTLDEKTDARWSKPGTQTVNGHRRASRWSFYSFRRRASVVWLVLLATVLAIGGGVLAPDSTAVVARELLWFVVLPSAVWGWWEWSRRYTWRKDVLRPLGEALAARLNDARYQLDPRTWLHVPVDTQDRPTRVYLPVGYDPTPAQEKSLVALVARRVGLVAPSWAYELRGEAPYLELTPAPVPREAVLAGDVDVRAALDNRAEGHLLLGLGPRDTPIWVDLEAESPHIGLSMATGAGKSVATKALMMQVLHDGGIVLVLDRKIESQLWALEHPGVRYACSAEDIYQALMDASGEINRRFELVRERRFAGETLDRAEIGPRLLVVAEEINTLEIDLRIWWRSIRLSSDPAMCPALPVLGRLLAMGRAGRCHLDVVAQLLTCQAIGGPAARENLSTRVLGRATTRAWNMLAPECKTGGRFPKSSRHRGRVHVVIGDEATPCQVLFASDEDAMAYAREGTVTEFPAMREVADGAGSPGETVADEVPHLSLVPATEPEDEIATSTLADWVSVDGEVDRNRLKSLRNLRDRDERFPEPVVSGPGIPSRYRVSDLEAFDELRAVGVGGDAS